MTLLIEPPPGGAEGANAPTSRTRARGAPAALTIGLVNNMPDSALEGTENQFTTLLGAAAADFEVRLRLAALPEVPRGAPAAARIAEHYWRIDDLMSDPPDALIVTGTEPRAASLRDEPYWARFVELMEFADAHTVSTVWSCLAAHAAVLECDAIERRRLPAKRCGVYGHALLSGHPLAAGLESPHPVPHSRWNDLPVAALREAGYTILSESPDTGADAFVKRRRSTFVFLQGHPEYEQRTLLKEYQRDVARFVNGEQPTYPTLPAGYFGAQAVALLAEFRRDLEAGQLADPLAAFPFVAVAQTLSNGWRAPAARLYGNWLNCVAELRSGRGARDRFAV